MKIYGRYGSSISFNEVVTELTRTYNMPVDLAEKVAGWYRKEGAFEDFSSVHDFMKYLKTDIFDMLDAASDSDFEEIYPYIVKDV